MIVQYQLLSRGLPLSFEFNICSLYLRCQICQFEALRVRAKITSQNWRPDLG